MAKSAIPHRCKLDIIDVHSSVTRLNKTNKHLSYTRMSVLGPMYLAPWLSIDTYTCHLAMGHPGEREGHLPPTSGGRRVKFESVGTSNDSSEIRTTRDGLKRFGPNKESLCVSIL